MKRSFFLALMFLAGVTGMHAQTVLDNDFTQVAQFERYTVVDQNHDGLTWVYDDLFQAARCSRDYDADDWLFTPMMSLSADKTYRLTLRASIDMEGAEQLAVSLGDRAAVQSMTQELMPAFSVTNTVEQPRSVTFCVAATGNYCVGFHVSTTGDPYSNSLYLHRLVVEETQNPNVPAAVTGLSVVAGEGGAPTVAVSFSHPSLTLGGEALEELSTVSIYRDELLVKTIDNPLAGAEEHFDDTNVSEGQHTYRVVPVNSYGEGVAAEATVYVGIDVPGPVENLRFVYDHAAKRARLTWDAPTTGAHGGYIDTDGLTYNVRRLRATAAETVTGVAGNSYEEDLDVDYLLMKEEELRKQYEEMGMTVKVEFVVDGQCLMQYMVSAVSDKGQGAEGKSNNVVIGEQDTLPYNDSFAGGNRTHYWRLDIATTRARWAVMGDARYTQDGDGGMLNYNAVENEVATAMVHTGNISMKDTATPVLSFYYYYAYAMTEPLVVKVSKEDGEFETLTTIDMSDESQRGRYIRASVPLTGCAGCDYVKVGFEVTSTTSVDLVYLDNVSIIDQRDHDLSILISQLPRNLKVGETRYMTAEVRNLGTADAAMGQYTVNAYVNNVLAGTSMGTTLAPGTAQAVMVPVQATIDMQAPLGTTALDLQGTLYAEVVYDADERMENNRTADEVLTVKMPRYPAATNLSAATTGGEGVTLSWSEPAAPRTEDGQVTDSFEEYADFRTANFGDWTLYDLDHQLTWTPGPQWRYANAGNPQAYMIWNNSQVENANTQAHGLNNEMWKPRTGEKCLASFGVSLDNCDDWLVSPELSGNAQVVSFYAHGVADSEGTYTEQFQLYISTSGYETTNFMALDQSPRLTTTAWDKYEYVLPAGAKYFALRKVTPADDSYVMFIDDITFAPDTLASQASLMRFGYNVYKNGARLNSSLVSQPSFSDPAGQPGDVYRVTVVYNQGESVYSNAVVVAGSEGIAVVSTSDGATRQPRYNLSGRRQLRPAKGIAIERGKKTLVR